MTERTLLEQIVDAEKTKRAKKLKQDKKPNCKRSRPDEQLINGHASEPVFMPVFRAFRRPR